MSQMPRKKRRRPDPSSGSVYWCPAPGEAVRVLVINHVEGDTFAVVEEGEVSLVDSETLRQLLLDLGSP